MVLCLCACIVSNTRVRFAFGLSATKHQRYKNTTTELLRHHTFCLSANVCGMDRVNSLKRATVANKKSNKKGETPKGKGRESFSRLCAIEWWRCGIHGDARCDDASLVIAMILYSGKVSLLYVSLPLRLVKRPIECVYVNKRGS